MTTLFSRDREEAAARARGMILRRRLARGGIPLVPAGARGLGREAGEGLLAVGSGVVLGAVLGAI